MGELSPIHWLIVLAIIVLLFGGRRIPEVMRGLGEGIRSFKEGVRGDMPNTTGTPQGTAQVQSTQAAPAAAPPAAEKK
jgi:sec-independent protein translocase protein TatA